MSIKYLAPGRHSINASSLNFYEAREECDLKKVICVFITTCTA